MRRHSPFLPAATALIAVAFAIGCGAIAARPATAPVTPAVPTVVAAPVPPVAPPAKVAPAPPAESVVVATPPTPAPAIGLAFPHEHSDLTPDPTVAWGRLSNGLGYAIMPNQQPREKVSLRLLVASGSLLETDAQRGLAHYLEHLAFAGSTHYPPGALVKQLQALGLAFGHDTNAHTSFDETVYKLDLPDADPATVATGLTVMADFAGGLSLLPAEIERERGVILAEMRDRDTPSYRQWLALTGSLYPGLTIPARHPIGTPATVSQATPELIFSFYRDWYRPERMFLTVVGAIDPAATAAQVRERFATLIPSGPSRQDTERGELRPAELAVLVHHEDEADGTELVILRVFPDPIPIDGVSERRADLARTVAAHVLNRRFQDLVARQPEGPLVGVVIGGYRWLDFYHVTAQAQAKPDRVLESLPIVEQELRRFVRFGPTATELAVAVRAEGAALDDAVAKAANRSNAQLATQLHQGVRHGEVFLSPIQERDLYRPLLAALTVAEVRAAATERDRGHRLVAVLGRDDLGPEAEARLRAAVAASTEVEVAAPMEKSLPPWAYGRDWQALPADGRPVPAEIVTDLERGVGVHRYQFGGTVVLAKRTEFKPNEVLVQLRLELPPAPRLAGLAELASMAFTAGGLGRHSTQELQDILAGATVRLSPLSVDEDAVLIGASCRPEELELCFQELRAFLLDPGWRPDAEAAAKAAWLDRLKALDTDLDQRVQRAFQARVVSDAPQRRAATLAEAEAVGFAQVRPWLEPVFSTAPLTVAAVGDLDADAVQDLAVTYFSRPERSPHTLTTDPADRSRLAEGAPWPIDLVRLEVPGVTPRALIRIAWPTDDMFDIGKTRRLGILAGVFTELLRQRIREQMGEAYSPFAWREASSAYRGFGFLAAQVGVAPDLAEQARLAVLAIAADLAAHGVDDQLLAQAKTPVVKSLAAQRQQNQYWLGSVLSRAAAQPFRLDWAATMEADYDAITAAELSDLAKRYLDNDRAFQVVGVCLGK